MDHVPSPLHLALGTDLERLHRRRDVELTIGTLDDIGTTIVELGRDVVLRVRGIRGVDDDGGRAFGRSWVNLGLDLRSVVAAAVGIESRVIHV